MKCHCDEVEALRAKVARVEETIQREGKLHSTWDKHSEMVVPVDALRAALADAPAEQRAEPTKKVKDSCAAHCRPSQGDYCGGPCMDRFDALAAEGDGRG